MLLVFQGSVYRYPGPSRIVPASQLAHNGERL